MPLFPPAERSVYQRTPLKNVTCELRFPQILRVQAEVPSDFQEKIRDHFVRYEKVNSVFLGELPPELVKLMGVAPAGISHRFSSEDGYVLALTAGTLSVSTDNYTRWEDFQAKLEIGLQSLIEIYRPANFDRIGLRYQNFIDRSQMGIEDWSWRDLVRAELAGELALDNWAEVAVEASSHIRCPVNDKGDFVRLQHGLAQLDGAGPFVYGLDFDFYADEKVEIKDALGVIERLHSESGPAFRWSISDRLHEEMAPHPA